MIKATLEVEKLDTYLDDEAIYIYFEYFPSSKGIRDHGIRMTDDFPENIEIYKVIPSSFKDDPRIDEIVWKWIRLCQEEASDAKEGI